MIYPRLKVSRSLLCDDGIILISINDKEYKNLVMVCDEVFGESNRFGTLIWEETTQSINAGIARFGLQKKTEYILMYGKDKKNVLGFDLERIDNDLEYPHQGKFGACRYEIIEKSDAGSYNRPTMKFKILGQYPRKGKRWQIGEETARILEKDEKVEIVDGIVKRAIYPEDELDKVKFKPFWSLLLASDFGTAQKGKDELNLLFQGAMGFDTVKPIDLIRKLLSYIGSNCVVLDFFSGSATTAHAVMQLNAEDGGDRRFIMVQLPEVCGEKTEAYKAGYKNICEIGKERIRRAGEKIKAQIEEENAQLKIDEEPKKIPDIGFRVFKLDSSNLKKWQPDYDNLEKTLLDSIENYVEGRSELDVVYEIILKMGLDLTYPVDELDVNGRKIYSVAFGALMICLDDHITKEIADGMISLYQEYQPELWKVVFKDNGFENDSAKTNIKEQLKAAGLEEDAFTTI